MSEIKGGIPCGYPAENSGIGVLLNRQFAESAERVVSITRSGVVMLLSRGATFSVNGEILDDYIRQEIERRHPVVDHFENFAGRVTIRVELLGDLEDNKGEK